MSNSSYDLEEKDISEKLIKDSVFLHSHTYVIHVRLNYVFHLEAYGK